MFKLLLVCFLALLLPACSLFHIHRVEVEQGNALSEQSVNEIQPGMSEEEVKDTLGAPVLVNVLDRTHVDYIYTTQLGSNPRLEKRLTLTFHHGVLQYIQREGI